MCQNVPRRSAHLGELTTSGAIDRHQAQETEQRLLAAFGKLTAVRAFSFSPLVLNLLPRPVHFFVAKSGCGPLNRLHGLLLKFTRCFLSGRRLPAQTVLPKLTLASRDGSTVEANSVPSATARTEPLGAVADSSHRRSPFRAARPRLSDFAAAKLMRFDTRALAACQFGLCFATDEWFSGRVRGISVWSVLSQTFREFINDECPRLAAAMAYYTFFSLPALLVAVVFTAGLIFDREAVAERLRSHFEETIGRAGAEQITAILQNASQPRQSGGGWAVGAVMLVLGATGALQELQTALNRAWCVEPDRQQSTLQTLLVKRLLSLALLLVLGLLLVASLTASWALAAFGHWIDASGESWLSSHGMAWLNTAVSLSVITLLFAALLRLVPDAQVAWSDVWSGAVVTALLFWLGQWALGLYFAWSRPTSAYGAAGSLALVLLWIYYSALIFFFGAEFTHVRAQRRGKRVAPVPGAKHAPPKPAAAGFQAAAR
jgi:membrane protein